ncbi:regulatory-associated protein of mTOR isoform X2 [Anoplophora glabripennis]|uniref:regulatory-associated protein of mTOR isoform X2 n=1 Tax=Anoplophora glabripennis TaxID=217634 RepID=UPI0008755F3C|nr:regulatory-associated protein of mTOR isoform X2 [Anoplophora glabripennis]
MLTMAEVTANGDKEEVDEKEIITDKDLPLSFTQDRHLEPIQGIDCITQTWRMKERMKTVSVALVLCLNVGVDPPDVVKTQPCARLECWIDPMQMSSTKALEKIGQTLQTQYERWQPRARYKQSLDPTSDEVKKLCTSLRRNAKEERVLFHYNGHGVPKPTTNGEIWVFNRTYTQYIPLSIFDLQTWMGAPSIYVYDCSNAGIIVDSFKQFAIQHEVEFEQSMSQQKMGSAHPPPSYRNCIQLAACSANQVLPMTPDLPADLFTACLTTPIKVALRWFVLQPTSKLMPKITLDLVDNIPGQITDRRTMLGELNWIFTAITDTIAWNTLPRELFQKLFRQDLLVASLFRNFLLAERIMRSCDCTPVSHPALPPTYQHPMWDAWDLALDLSLGQLPKMLKNEEQFQHLPFFEEQLTAFQVWLELGSEERNPPEQLPIVLQVLLSQIHRMRALELLGRFLDLGPWAVNLALSVGIFPYVLKLLQSCARELRPLLVFIWAKIFAVDNTCQTDLVRDSGHKYFLSVVQDTSVSPEHRTQATFILACIVTNFHDGQEAALQSSLLSVCLEQLSDPYPHLRQWVAICLGRLWDHYEKARWTGVRDIAHEKLYTLLRDPCPEVRSAAIYALGTFINSVTERSEHANNIDHSIVMTLVNTVSGDMSSLVRKELINALQWVVLSFEHVFVNLAVKEHNSISPVQDTIPPLGMRRAGSKDRDLPRLNDYDSIKKPTNDTEKHLGRVPSSPYLNHMGNSTMSQSLGTLPGLGYGSVYMKLWNSLCSLETDPHPEVAQMCCTVTGYIRAIAKEQRDFVDNRSVSLPPSPKQNACFPGESPPTLHPPGDLQKLTRPTSRSRRMHRNTLNENNDDKLQFCRKPLVHTKFVEWSSKRFAQSNKKDKVTKDPESSHFYERDWRHTRNNDIRIEATEEQRRALSCRVESQVFHTRTAVAPSLLQLHPFDKQIAVAGNDSFAIWDWSTGAKTTICQNKSSKSVSCKVTAIEWINGHDIAMLMVASDDGSVKLWRPNVGMSREPSLISAWQAFSELKPTEKKSAGIVMTWEQWTQTLITSGDTRVLRFWDADKELKAFDIPTGTDSSVTCIDATFSSICHENHKKYHKRYGLDDEGLIIDNDEGLAAYHGPRLGMCAVGCGDGSVRLFDRRCNPSEAKVRVWMEHPSSVLGIQLRDNLIVSGSSAGDVKIYDIRKNDSIHTTQAVQNSGMSCISIHRSANTFACGSLNQSISIYTLKGTLINTIRFYEGFMGHKIGPVTCLNYHPHKVALATGTMDCCVNVYSLEGRR